MGKQEIIGLATEDQIATWKKIHNINEVYSITVSGHRCYVRPFDRNTMKYAMSLMRVQIDVETQHTETSMDRMIEIGEVGLQNCWLGGSEKIKTNDKLWISAAIQMGALFEWEEAELEKH